MTVRTSLVGTPQTMQGWHGDGTQIGKSSWLSHLCNWWIPEDEGTTVVYSAALIAQALSCIS